MTSIHPWKFKHTQTPNGPHIARVNALGMHSTYTKRYNFLCCIRMPKQCFIFIRHGFNIRCFLLTKKSVSVLFFLSPGTDWSCKAISDLKTSEGAAITYNCCWSTGCVLVENHILQESGHFPSYFSDFLPTSVAAVEVHKTNEYPSRANIQFWKLSLPFRNS